MDKVLESFIKRCKQRMEELKINQVDLAKRLGVPQPAVSHYLKGHRKPTSESIARYAEALECSPAFLVDTQDDISRMRNPSPEELAAIVLEKLLPEGERKDAALLLLNCDEDTFKGMIGGLRPFLKLASKSKNISAG